MQYILSEEEMAAHHKKLDESRHLPTTKELQKFCTMVADNMLVKQGWYKGKAWGCILTRKEEWYCDDCPAKDICPYTSKHWSQ